MANSHSLHAKLVILVQQKKFFTSFFMQTHKKKAYLSKMKKKETLSCTLHNEMTGIVTYHNTRHPRL